VPRLTPFDIKCIWFNENCYNEFFSRRLLPSRSARRFRAYDFINLWGTNRIAEAKYDEWVYSEKKRYQRSSPKSLPKMLSDMPE
jgi:hypothetical protein